MTYALVIKQQAKKKLQSLSRIERVRIAEHIQLLGLNPDDPVLDIKKLVGEPCYRMRVGIGGLSLTGRMRSGLLQLKRSNHAETHTNEHTND